MDFDRDGWPDLFFPGGGNITKAKTLTPLPGSLWRNDFGKDFTNVSRPSGCDAAKYYSQGASSGDLNNDGFPDLLVTGYGGLQLFVNQGDGTFLELADILGLEDANWSTSAGFGDFDNDGSLDLYVANYVDWSWEKNPECKSSGGGREICPRGVFKGLQDVIFMSNGDGSFRSVTSEAGLVAEGRGLGVVCADFNQDSKLDVYVANDAVNNFLYVNQGNGGNSNFRHVTLLSSFPCCFETRETENWLDNNLNRRATSVKNGVAAVSRALISIEMETPTL